MLFKIIKLLLPALIPSWNFFDYIAPSPRVEFSLLQPVNQKSVNQKPTEWQPYRPRPEYLSFIQMLKRMLWNPGWNESLYIMSCAERIIAEPILPDSQQHSETEITKRIRRDLLHTSSKYRLDNITHIQFRLQLRKREGDKLVQIVCFTSRIAPLHEHQ